MTPENELVVRTLFTIITILMALLTGASLVTGHLFSDHGGDKRMRALMIFHRMLTIYFTGAFAASLLFPKIEQITIRWTSSIFLLTMLLGGYCWLIWVFSERKRHNDEAESSDLEQKPDGN